MMALSAIIGDKRLSINSEIKEKCLDGMRDIEGGWFASRGNRPGAIRDICC